jgi:hypothetical protein
VADQAGEGEARLVDGHGAHGVRDGHGVVLLHEAVGEPRRRLPSPQHTRTRTYEDTDSTQGQHATHPPTHPHKQRHHPNKDPNRETTQTQIKTSQIRRSRPVRFSLRTSKAPSQAGESLPLPAALASLPCHRSLSSLTSLAVQLPRPAALVPAMPYRQRRHPSTHLCLPGLPVTPAGGGGWGKREGGWGKRGKEKVGEVRGIEEERERECVKRERERGRERETVREREREIEREKETVTERERERDTLPPCAEVPLESRRT